MVGTWRGKGETGKEQSMGNERAGRIHNVWYKESSEGQVRKELSATVNVTRHCTYPELMNVELLMRVS
jgi:hypothetical protein